MLAAMNADPNYLCGWVFRPDIGVYAGWVAPRDSFAARQSGLEGPAGQRLVFSGECFAQAFSAAGGLDDDVLQRYRARGERFAQDLNGLFSGLLIDPSSARAWLFNDRFGSERIYCFEDGDTTYFASEAKALLHVLPQARRLDNEGVADFLRYGSVHEGRTLFRGIHLLPGASLWRFEAKGAAVGRSSYFRASEWENQDPLSEADFQAAFKEAFVRRLPAYLRSDARIGISLTGGLDTRMIMAGLRLQEGRPAPVCYTFAGLRGETRDVQLGAAVARHLGLEYHVLRVGPELLSQFPHYLDRTVAATDGCAGATTAHEIYLTSLARQLAPIRLTGNFGSEILRSMSTLKPLGLADQLLAPAWRLGDAAAPAASAQASVHPVTYAAFREVPWHLFGTLAASRSQLRFRSPYLDNELVRLAFRAPPAARKSAKSALLLIKDLSPDLAAIPTDRAVRLAGGPLQPVRRAIAEITFKLDYYHMEGLPNALAWLDAPLRRLDRTHVLGQHKFLPYRNWFRNELAGYVADVFSESRVRHMPYWNAVALPSILADHVLGRRNHTKEINAVLTLESVDRQLLHAAAVA